VRIDRTHKSWLIASLVVLGVATAVYFPYAKNSIMGPRGGSAIGLGFGILGSAFMIFSGLLAARKKVEVWRLGRAQSMILFHGGFRFGGPLTAVLMVLLILVVASGLFGAALQHYLPRVMTSEVPLETIFEQIDHVRAELLEEADELIARASAPLKLVRAAPSGDLAATADSILSAEETFQPLRNFYAREMRPFLEDHRQRNQPLADEEKAPGIFEGLRRLLPAGLHETTRSLEEICDEVRQLRRQVRLHHLLHGWLMLHVPLSFALLILACAHAVMALRY
jgi:hypothetical protein